MFKPLEVRPLPGYRIWLSYDDGASGEVDLSHLVGKGVFAVWEEPSVFSGVRIGEHGRIAWAEDVDLCPDALYLRLTGMTAEEAFTRLKEQDADA
jgi:hypothetical protein